MRPLVFSFIVFFFFPSFGTFSSVSFMAGGGSLHSGGGEGGGENDFMEDVEFGLYLERQTLLQERESLSLKQY